LLSKKPKENFSKFSKQRKIEALYSKTIQKSRAKREVYSNMYNYQKKSEKFQIIAYWVHLTDLENQEQTKLQI
jgi:hypothetical protein